MTVSMGNCVFVYGFKNCLLRASRRGTGPAPWGYMYWCWGLCLSVVRRTFSRLRSLGSWVLGFVKKREIGWADRVLDLLLFDEEGVEDCLVESHNRVELWERNRKFKLEYFETENQLNFLLRVYVFLSILCLDISFNKISWGFCLIPLWADSLCLFDKMPGVHLNACKTFFVWSHDVHDKVSFKFYQHQESNF